MKVGDKYVVVERGALYPNGEWSWNGVISMINGNIFEVEYFRTEEPWLMEIIKEQLANEKLKTNHRTFFKQTIRFNKSLK